MADTFLTKTVSMVFIPIGKLKTEHSGDTELRPTYDTTHRKQGKLAVKKCDKKPSLKNLKTPLLKF